MPKQQKCLALPLENKQFYPPFTHLRGEQMMS
jgi:hypothetical protein